MEENGGKLVFSIEDDVNEANQQTSSKVRLKVTFPDGNIIERLKTTETFATAISSIGITRIKKLKIIVLKLPLIGNTKSEKYQQRALKKDVYLVTQISNEKKVEILNFISDKLKLNLKVELINDK